MDINNWGSWLGLVGLMACACLMTACIAGIFFTKNMSTVLIQGQ